MNIVDVIRVGKTRAAGILSTDISRSHSYWDTARDTPSWHVIGHYEVRIYSNSLFLHIFKANF